MEHWPKMGKATLSKINKLRYSMVLSIGFDDGN